MFKSSKLYRTQKRLAAIWILEKITVAPKMAITTIVEGNNRTEVNQKNYSWHKLKDLIPVSPYERILLRDACDLLFIKDHIDICDNKIDVFDIEVKALKVGEIAFKEDFYQDDISNYNSERQYRNLRWWIPSAALLISLISLIISTCKKTVIQVQVTQQMPKS